MQILIQSKKEDLEKHFQNIKNSEKLKLEIIKRYTQEYIDFLQNKNSKNNSASKNIYLIIKSNNLNEGSTLLEENIFQELNEKFFKIKEYLLKCGNVALECSRDETIQILFSFLNSKKFLNK